MDSIDLARDSAAIEITAEQREHPIVSVARRLHSLGMHLFFCLPLVFSPGLTESLFEIPKSTALALFTVLTVGSGLTYILLRGHFVLRRTSTDIPLLVLLAISALATLFSISPLYSLYGEYGRRDGLLTLANYALLYFMTVSYFTGVRGIRRAMELLVLVASFVALIGILESQGVWLHSVGARATFAGRVFSTVGNPDLLGSYLVLLIPLSIGLLLTVESKAMKLLWSVAFLLMAACLIATLTRGAWIGFMASLAILVLFARLLRPHALWLIGLLVATMIVGAGFEASRLIAERDAAHLPPGGLSSASDGAPVLRTSVLDRLISMTNLKGGTVQVRFETWQQALDIVRHYPILGTGLNTFQMAATRYYSPEYARGEGADHMPDRPHNQYLQWAAFAGVPGLLSYLAVLGAVLWSWLRWLRRGQRDSRRLLLIGILAGWGGYLVQNFFLFETITTASQFWLITALGVGITRSSSANIRLWRSHLPSWILHPAVGAIVLAAAYLSFLAVRPVVADVLYWRGQTQLQSRNAGPVAISAAFASMEAAINWLPHEQRYREMYALILLGKASQPGLPDSERRRYLSTASTVITQAIADNPSHANLYFTRGTIRAQLDSGQLSGAYGDYRRAVELFPYFRAANRAVARTARQMGKPAEAILAEERILVLYPGDALTLADVAQDYLAVGNVEEAQQAVTRLSRAIPDSPFTLYLQGRVYEERADPTAAAAQYERAIERQADLKPALDGLERLRRKSGE